MLSYLVTPICAALLLCGIFGIVWLRSNLTSVEYSISELEKGRLEKLKETKMLMAEKSALFALQKGEKAAVTELGLVFPSRTKVVYVKESSSGPQNVSFEAKRNARIGAVGMFRTGAADGEAL